MSDPALLAFSTDEYASRVKRLRETMRHAGVDITLVTGPENQFYLTGLRTGTVHTFMVLIVPVEGDALWVVRQTELSNVETLAPVSWVKRGHGVADGESPIAVLADVLRDTGFERSVIGVDRRSYFFHTEFQHQLEVTLPEARLVDATAGWRPAGRSRVRLKLWSSGLRDSSPRLLLRGYRVNRRRHG